MPVVVATAAACGEEMRLPERKKNVNAVWTSSLPSGLPGIPLRLIISESQTPVCPDLGTVLIILVRLKDSRACQFACTKTNQLTNTQTKKSPTDSQADSEAALAKCAHTFENNRGQLTGD